MTDRPKRNLQVNLLEPQFLFFNDVSKNEINAFFFLYFTGKGDCGVIGFVVSVKMSRDFEAKMAVTQKVVSIM